MFKNKITLEMVMGEISKLKESLSKTKLDIPHPNTCENCPRRFDPNGCEKWITPDYGFQEKNDITGEIKIVTGCFYKVIPKLMMHIVKSCNETTASSDKTRNRVAKLGQLIPIALHQENLKPKIISAEEVILSLEHKEK